MYDLHYYPIVASSDSPRNLYKIKKLPKASHLTHKEHLTANAREILTFGVFFFVLIAVNKAFTAPRIYTVEAGNLAKFTRLLAWAIKLAPTTSPSILVRLEARACIRLVK